MELTAQGLPANQSLASLGLLALGTHADDVTAVSADWSNGINPSDYGLSFRRRLGPGADHAD